MEPPLSVLIVDDAPSVRHGLRVFLTHCSEVKVIGEAADGQEALRLVAERRPNVVLMDAQMPGMDGLAATRAIKERWPEVRVVVLTMHGGYRADALAAGADAFFLKGAPTDELLGRIRDTGHGRPE